MTAAAKQLLGDLVEALEFNRNPEAAEPMAKYMKYHFVYLGLPQPLRKALSKDFLKAAKALAGDDVLALAAALWKKKEREYQYIAIELLQQAQKKWDERFIAFFLELVTLKSWWDSVDVIAARLVGAYYAGSAVPAVMNAWRQSDNIWQNRTALIFQLLYKENTDTRFLLKAIQSLKHKKAFFVQKAIGWSLRQHYRIDPAWVVSVVESEGLTGVARREALKHD